MINDKVGLLENERLLYRNACRAAMASSRGTDLKLARQDVEELNSFALHGSTEQLRAGAEGVVRSIAEAPESNQSARRAARVDLARLARVRAGLPMYGRG